MIIISGTMSFNESDLPEVRANMVEVMAASRRDSGCVEYNWTESLETPGTFRFFECWASPDDLNAHMALPHVVAFNDNTLVKLTDVSATSYTATAD